MAPKSETPMTYRELQAQAKSLGLPAKGKRAALEARIAAAGSNGSADANESEPALKYDGGIRLWPNGLAGIDQDGLFGVVPGYVNRKLAPGNSSILEELGAAMTFRSIATLAHFIWSPNAIWFAMAAALHYFAPYDLTLENPFSLAWMLPRFALNFAVAFAYYGFFFAALYIFKCGATRKYRPGSFPTVGNMAHNLWYWSLGIVQWTFWEAVMVKLWKRTDGGGVAMKTDAEVMSSNKLIAINLFWIIFIPVWRDAHFYIAHRFLHIRSIYTYVHKLHHRNADPEPFSGICMHPVEHMYYYACAFIPSLYLSSLSPLIFTWNFIHLTIAPGAGHSGFEDHFQADNYHFIHHAKFECNYGSPMSGFVDQALGTFRESLTKSRVYVVSLYQLVQFFLCRTYSYCSSYSPSKTSLIFMFDFVRTRVPYSGTVLVQIYRRVEREKRRQRGSAQGAERKRDGKEERVECEWLPRPPRKLGPRSLHYLLGSTLPARVLRRRADWSRCTWARSSEISSQKSQRS
tara:strand:- start:1192 stop:2742 length:1551 start_codon:yes stop_codon:yes gene_type:complete